MRTCLFALVSLCLTSFAVSQPTSSSPEKVEIKNAAWLRSVLTSFHEQLIQSLNGEADVPISPSEFTKAVQSSEALKTSQQLRSQVLGYLNQASVVMKEMENQKAIYLKVESEEPTMMDKAKMSTEEWRKKRQEEIEKRWELRSAQLTSGVNQWLGRIVIPSDSQVTFADTDTLAVEADRLAKHSAREEKVASSEKLRLIVDQIVPQGALVELLKGEAIHDIMSYRGGGGNVGIDYVPSGKRVFVFGLPPGLAEQDRKIIRASRNGTHTYTDVMGASRTVHAYEFISELKE